MTEQRQSIECLIDREVEDLALYVNQNHFKLADYQLGRVNGMITASYYADIITTKEYDFLIRAITEIRY